jgi:hypothetical protein
VVRLTHHEASPLDDPSVLEMYVMEVRTQCRFALYAMGDVVDRMSKLDGPPDHETSEELNVRLFGALQAFVVAAGCVSQLLWSSKESESSRRPLRDALSIGDSSPLKDRRIRNHFVHIDDRLDGWSRLPNRSFADRNFFPRDSAMDTRSWFRNLDPKSWTLTFRGEDFDVRAIKRALVDLERAAKAWGEANLRRQMMESDDPETM